MKIALYCSLMRYTPSLEIQQNIVEFLNNVNEKQLALKQKKKEK
ncbi:hypothetical protein [Solitalea lacus]|nr:hypothetical protein [Solitalea lacus]